MRAIARLAGMALCAAAVGCSFAPRYKVPDTGKAPDRYKESADWKVAEPQDTAPRGAWWARYEDAGLDALEEKIQGSNLTLKAAFARLQQARAQYRIARADLFPTVTANPSAAREHFSANAPRTLPGYALVYNDFVLGADFSYEIDLWGRVRNEVTAARANRQASAADLASIELALRAQLAEDYFNLRADDAEVKLLDETVQAYQKSFDLETQLFQGGAAALADVAQAQAQLDNACTQDSDVRLQRAQAEHAIAVLMGESPSTFSLAVSPLPIEVAPPPIDPGLPSTLLERRPDIAEAERRVAAANAQIGEARAAYFPRFTLAASGGFESTRTSNLLTVPSRFWSIGPQLSLPVFEAGRLVAQTAQAKGVYEEQVADYRNTVLTAYQDVEDNLAALRQLQAENDSNAAAVQATRISLQQVQDQYNAGIVTYLEVAVAQTAALQAQVTAVSIQARRMSASVLLIKALGGGWQSPPGSLGKR
ncbi:MAG TPA: efflux transporter outer membrane subunit [Steroidobacteraceae bacterium]|nr:efflux transporter outer membrane subunit [Steroidobacteraceae bacterium]